MKAFLQGQWLGHPLHPALVHIPTALWPAALIFDLLNRFGVGGNVLVRAATYAILVGLIGALAAVPTGIADWSGIKRDRPAWKIGLIHMVLNLAAMLLWLVNLVMRWDTRDTAVTVGTPPLVLSVVGTVILAVSGYLGGLMVFEYGISVARLSKDKWRRIAAAGRAHLPEGG